MWEFDRFRNRFGTAVHSDHVHLTGHAITVFDADRVPTTLAGVLWCVVRIRIIDAFADRPFTGNPAAVCLLDGEGWPDLRWMQQVAAEMNLSETAFAHPLPGSVEADWALRWFTPTVEVDLCGHATLATAHALHSDRGSSSTVRFSSRSGILVARTRDDGTIILDFPAAQITAIPIPDGFS